MTPDPTLYRLKPLGWTQIRPAEHEDGEWWTAATVFGPIDVEYDPGNGYWWRYCFDEYYDEDKQGCDSIEAGKVLAERFYRWRIAGALESA